MSSSLIPYPHHNPYSKMKDNQGGGKIDLVFIGLALWPPPSYHVFADISVGGCERICSYTPPQISSK